MGYNLHAAIAEPREAVAASSSISKRLSKKKKKKNITLSLAFQERPHRVSDVARTTGDEATRKVAGDKARSPAFIFAFFVGMRSRYLQSPPLQSVRHPPAHTSVSHGLTGSGYSFFLLLLFLLLRLFTYCLLLPLFTSSTCASDLRS